MHGYRSPEYGLSFSELGEVITLPESGVQVLRRQINEELFDVFGLYPYTVTDNWTGLRRDLGFLRELGAVSVALVSDPFADNLAPAALRDWTVCKPFKTHHAINLYRDWRGDLSRKMRKHARRAKLVQQVEVTDASSDMADQFWRLYLNLINKRNVSGLQRLSRDIMARQLDIPGAMIVSARDESGVLSQAFYFGDGSTAHGHLWGSTPRGYELNSSYAMLWDAFETFEKKGYARVNLGGAVGYDGSANDSVAAFKRRWANEQRTTFICGQILDVTHYNSLTKLANATQSDFFPAYRTPDAYINVASREAS